MKLTTILTLLLVSVFCSAQSDTNTIFGAGSGVVSQTHFRLVCLDTSEQITAKIGGSVKVTTISSTGSIFTRPAFGEYRETDWHYRNGRFTRIDLYHWEKEGGAPLLSLKRIAIDSFESWHLYNIGVSDSRFNRIADLMCDSVYTGRVVGWSCEAGGVWRTRKLDIYQNRGCWGCVPGITNDAQMMERLRRAILNSRNPNYPKPKGQPWPCPEETQTPIVQPVEVKRDTVRLFSGSGDKQ